MLRSTLDARAEGARALREQILARRIEELRRQAEALEAEADRADAEAFPHFARACAALGLPEPPRAAIKLMYRRVFLPADANGIDGADYPPRGVWARPLALRERAAELRRKAERLEQSEASREAEISALIST